MVDYLSLDVRKMPDKSRKFLYELYRVARVKGLDCAISRNHPPCRALVIFGLGGADRYSVGMSHVAAGKPLLSFDLGYWDRALPQRKYRFSLNGLHPTQVMAGPNPGPARFKKSRLKIQTLPAKPDGPILLVGNAPKSIAVGARNWTAEKSRELRAVFPGRKILYRPKPKRPAEPGVEHDGVSTAPIEKELGKVSLVVCRHSNVAVDACLHGVPVVCDDGAAACIYPQALSEWQQQPGPATRAEFLHRLAWWQWGRHEVDVFWDWFLRTFPAHDYR